MMIKSFKRIMSVGFLASLLAAMLPSLAFAQWQSGGVAGGGAAHAGSASVGGVTTGTIAAGVRVAVIVAAIVAADNNTAGIEKKITGTISQADLDKWGEGSHTINIVDGSGSIATLSFNISKTGRKMTVSNAEYVPAGHTTGGDVTNVFNEMLSTGGNAAVSALHSHAG